MVVMHIDHRLSGGAQSVIDVVVAALNDVFRTNTFGDLSWNVGSEYHRDRTDRWYPSKLTNLFECACNSPINVSRSISIPASPSVNFRAESKGETAEGVAFCEVVGSSLRVAD